MSIIGTFTPTKRGGWSGTIRTLSIHANVAFIPNDNREGENAPSFHVIFGQMPIGEAWTHRTAGNPAKEYLRVKLDDPSLIAPLNATLIPSEDRGEA